MTFEEWFHKEYEPADLQLKQYAKRKEGLHIPAKVYLEDIQKAYESGQKDSEAQIEKMKCCENCKHHCFWGNELNCRTLFYDEELKCMNTKEHWEMKEND